MTAAGVPWWHPANLVGSWFGTGYLPIASGTWGSLGALPFAWLIMDRFGPLGLALAAAAAFLAGIWASVVILRRSGRKDPSCIVIDEVAGQWIALLPVLPLDPVLYAIGFVLFRIFDVVKPWPANWCDQRMPGAWGVMLDDIVAGVYAAIALHLIALANLQFGFF